MSVKDNPVAENRLQVLPEPIANGECSLQWSEIANQPACRAKADGQQRALRACTAASFMVRSMDERLKRGTAADVEGADALGRIEFVAGDGEQVYAKPFHVRGNLSDRLRRISVQYNAMLARDMAYIANRLYR